MRPESTKERILYDACIVIAATDREQVNNEIYSVCKCMGIPVNVISDKQKCDFLFSGNRPEG